MQVMRIMGASQVDLLHSYLKARSYISPLVARQVLGIERLASRVYDLRKKGHAVSAAIHKDESGRRYTRYSLN